MKVKLKDIIESEFGIGPLVAVTKQWVIQDIGQNGSVEEVAIHRKASHISIPAEIPQDNIGGESYIKLQ